MMRVSRLLTLAATLLFWSALLSSDAAARSERLRWTHANESEMTGFTVQYGTAPGDYSMEVDVGIPPTDSTGRFVYHLDVEDSLTIYVTVSAYASDGRVSDFSNERKRLGQLGQPGKPQLVRP